MTPVRPVLASAGTQRVGGQSSRSDETSSGVLRLESVDETVDIGDGHGDRRMTLAPKKRKDRLTEMHTDPARRFVPSVRPSSTIEPLTPAAGTTGYCSDVRLIDVAERSLESHGPEGRRNFPSSVMVTPSLLGRRPRTGAKTAQAACPRHRRRTQP